MKTKPRACPEGLKKRRDRNGKAKAARAYCPLHMNIKEPSIGAPENEDTNPFVTEDSPYMKTPLRRVNKRGTLVFCVRPGFHPSPSRKKRPFAGCVRTRKTNAIKKDKKL